MDSKIFSQIRHHLGKTQNELAELLCVSPKAIQSFEQGWRKIPASAERQLLMLLSMEQASKENVRPCWEIISCPLEWRENCFVWEHKEKRFCWLISGTFCHGESQKNWEKKIEICWQCEVFHQAFPSMIGD